MLYPDPMQRVVLGWQIRWVAGLFALLMVAAGAIPVCSSDGADPLLDARNGALHATAEDEQATSAELCVETGEVLGAKSGSETEVERDDLDSACLPSMVRTLARRLPNGGDRSDADFALGRSVSGESAPRAPPLA